MIYHKANLFGIRKALKQFNSVYDILETTESMNRVFGLNFWKRLRKTNDICEYKLARYIKLKQVFSKYF